MSDSIPNPPKVATDADGNAGSLAAFREQGVDRLRAGQFAEAVAFLDRARMLDPRDPQTRLNLGLALQGAGRHTEALQHFTDLQKERPDSTAPFLHATASLLALGKPEDALGSANEACRRSPQAPRALYVYGQALLALDKLPQAEQAFAGALQHAPSWPEAWIQCGVARYRQGAVDGAKAAMRQALHVAPGHAVASANLQALMRAGSELKTNSANPARATPKPPPVRQTSVDEIKFSAWRPQHAAVSLGLAVEYLRKKPAFARLAFGEWSQVLVGQINRGHYYFIVDQHQRVHGFFGWALTQELLAEQWVEGRSGLRDEECRTGDCVIFNVWSAESTRAHRFMVDTGRTVIEGKRTLYFKRHYPDGRTRPVRLAATDFVTTHLARATARQRQSKGDTAIDEAPRGQPLA
jgi:tetratricopeptide (TPR) repeat protein